MQTPTATTSATIITGRNSRRCFSNTLLMRRALTAWPLRISRESWIRMAFCIWATTAAGALKAWPPVRPWRSCGGLHVSCTKKMPPCATSRACTRATQKMRMISASALKTFMPNQANQTVMAATVTSRPQKLTR